VGEGGGSKKSCARSRAFGASFLIFLLVGGRVFDDSGCI